MSVEDMPLAASELYAAEPWCAADLQILQVPDRPEHSAWLGGSLLGSLTASFRELCVTRQEYQEQGARVYYKRCF
eukprot:g78992.t1